MLAENLENLFNKERMTAHREGHKEGESRVLRKMIQVKFGVVPTWADDLIKTADSNQIDQWVESLMTAESLDELLN